MKIIRFEELIVQQHEDLLFINKPASVSSLDERNSPAKSILRLAKQYNPALQLCHRLDKETSGIMVLAQDENTYREIAILFEKRKIEKIYHAIVEGVFPAEPLEIDLPLSQTKKGIAVVDYRNGKKSQTRVQRIEAFRHYSLLECQPFSGRLHQIRIHLASQNFPLVADTVYGGNMPYLSKLKPSYKTSKFENEEPMLNRVALHARSLSFVLNEKKYEVAAPYPNDMAVFLKQLQKFDSR